MCMNQCKYLTKKISKILYCKKMKKEINFKNCNNCKYKEFKSNNCTKNAKMKNKTDKLAKLEKNRYSILTNNLNCCIICGKPKEHLHEVFFGRNRQNSMKYNCVIPLCNNCHTEMHKNKEWQDYWHKKGQKRFMEYYHKSIEQFDDIFKRNYL